MDRNEGVFPHTYEKAERDGEPIPTGQAIQFINALNRQLRIRRPKRAWLPKIPSLWD